MFKTLKNFFMHPVQIVLFMLSLAIVPATARLAFVTLRELFNDLKNEKNVLLVPKENSRKVMFWQQMNKKITKNGEQKHSTEF